MRFALACLLILTSQIAAASNFVEVKLPRGVELQLPKSWWLLSKEHNILLETSVEAAMDLSGIDVAEGVEVNLIAANSMPRSTYAAVRVDSTTPANVSPLEISNLTVADLLAYKAEMHRNLQKTLPIQGNQLLVILGVRRATISGHPALITGYRRSGPKGPVIVSIVQIFTPNQGISIFLAYRESEQAIWKPIIGKISKSIVVRRWP